MTSTDTTSTLPLRPGTWALDPAHSSVGFTIRHLGVAKVRGAFRRFEADVVIGDDLASTSVQAEVHVDSVDTGNAERDAHVLAEDMLDVRRRPTLAFRSTSIEPRAEDWALHGELTIGEVTRPVVLALDLGGLEAFPGDERRRAGFEARGEITRRDFGLMPGVPAAVLGDVVKIELDIELVEPA